MDRPAIATARLLLVPVTPVAAAAVLGGDLSGVTAGAGWPHAETIGGLRMVAEHGALGWFITLDGVVVGDCGMHGWIDERGDVEIGYGIARPHRNQGLATEAVGGLVAWVSEQPGLRRVVARRVRGDNLASRRVLERNGFWLDEVAAGEVSYARGLA
jgi:RimJ/RimL family protein N-acetyltransferase